MSRQLHLDSPRYPQPCGDRECRRCYPPTPAEARAAYVAAWDELQRSDLDRFREAVEQLHAAIAELLLPAMVAFADAVERLVDAWHDSRPVRWLNRRARRAAMRRHPSSRWQFTPITAEAGRQLGLAFGQGVEVAMRREAVTSAEALALRAGIRLPELPPARIYTPPAALSWVDVDRLAERAGQDLGTFDAILAAPTPAEIPPAPLCQPVNAGQHVGRMRRHTWRELLQLPGRDMA
ncbi:hypothetical protein SEA_BURTONTHEPUP_2 [Microbacterium phage BurtonThePup]|nr:hypothetical protein SEA_BURTONTHEPUP_2 [Microbacterium phage BurtonThePup]QDH84841.1 hypothetical protein SEA_SLENTZ_2 [Microbacterium phage Slentz]QDH85111.1 hypothetical protein SEA_CIEL_2 [Microbacterium phage Ciel]QFP97666.1 hypothetical protein SEA_TEDDYBOY_2 [Microbacterium phage TeddyBoy]QFP97783.1 hypothetical protein SEA_OWENS_2 [Microbacterium phage Owens]QGJ91494.1 hypothetical protein SEA_SCRUNCHY_2 [Microbacterium phage Scrunchy]QNJ59338.1 hypothetical protein SEA_MAJESTY_2 [